MTKRWIAVLVLAAFLPCLVGACATPQQGAVSGGVAGAAIGAIIGAACGSPELGALVGGAVGTAGGAIAGAENQRRLQEQYAQQLTSIPSDWKHPDGRIGQAPDGRVYYMHPCGDYLVLNPETNQWCPQN